LPSISRPSTSVSKGSKDGLSQAGFLKFRPSSPPVNSLNCEARVWKAVATASVIMAKKMAFTRRLNRPINKASSSETTNATASPRPTAAQPGPMRSLAMATP